MISDIADDNIRDAFAFLERHAETSLFLLSNLTELGPRLGESLNSGTVRCIEEDAEIVAVFCLTRRGNLLVQTAERSDLAAEILRACDAETIRIQGVIGEWRGAESLWVLLRARPGFQPVYESKEVLYRLDLSDRNASTDDDGGIRQLAPDDFAQWDILHTAYLSEDNLPVQGTPEQRKAAFTARAAAGYWWGAFEGSKLLSIVGLNAKYGSIGQVGGVYTPPEKRRTGLARAAMRVLLRDAVDRHHVSKVILFTGHHNIAARALYESLAFSNIGEFGMLFGSWQADLTDKLG